MYLGEAIPAGEGAMPADVSVSDRINEEELCVMLTI